jgi:DNA-binding NtrC family response regulator
MERPAENFREEPGLFPMPVILIVDDEALIRWSVGESLEAAGYQVIEAGTAGEALRAMDGAREIALVVLDLKLPDSSDLGLLRRVRAQAPGSPVILMTAHGTAEILEDARSLGACEVLEKPFDLRRFVDVVNHALQPA